jgi:hypothetical protein
VSHVAGIEFLLVIGGLDVFISSLQICEYFLRDWEEIHLVRNNITVPY